MSVFEGSPNDPKKAEINPFLKLGLELGPLAIFFFSNARFGLITATGVFMVATITALALSWWLTRRLAIMPLVTGIVVFIFGGLTLLLQDEIFIKMKPTIVNTLFGTVLLVGLWFGRPLLGYVFDSVFKLDDAGWRKLTFRWGLFLPCAGRPERSDLAQFLDRLLGRVQGVRVPADHGRVHAVADAPDPAACTPGESVAPPSTRGNRLSARGAGRISASGDPCPPFGVLSLSGDGFGLGH
jgi:intracellular septation protein